MVVVKSYPEASDKDAIYWNGDTPIEDLIGTINSDTIEFQGNDVVSTIRTICSVQSYNRSAQVFWRVHQ